MRLAVVPMEDGQDLREAVLHKSCRAARASLDAQAQDVAPGFRKFAAGYLAGFARHQALKHGVDAEQGEASPLHGLLTILAHHAPPALVEEVTSLQFQHRDSPRTKMRAADGAADAGYLVGHLESLCGTQRLLGGFLSGVGGDAFLTACDMAADRLQTHQPTMSLRFDPPERDAVRQAFSLSP